MVTLGEFAYAGSGHQNFYGRFPAANLRGSTSVVGQLHPVIPAAKTPSTISTEIKQ